MRSDRLPAPRRGLRALGRPGYAGLGKFGRPEMRRRLPLHRLDAIEERWQTLADADRPLRDLERASRREHSDGR